MRTRYRNVAFLVELMINILVFSISCAVLVGLFGKAGQLSKQTLEETKAGAEVQMLVETLKAGDVLDAPLGDVPGRYVFYYDANWQRLAAEAGAHYTIELTVQDRAAEAGQLLDISAQARSGNGREIYTVETSCYTPVW